MGRYEQGPGRSAPGAGPAKDYSGHGLVARQLWCNRICRDSALNSRCAQIGQLIASLRNDAKGYAWPSIETLARAAAVNGKTIRRAIARLEQRGYLHIERDAPGCPTNHYYLRLPQEPADSTKERDNVVPARGQNCPPEGDKSVPQSLLMNPLRSLHGTQAAGVQSLKGRAGLAKESLAANARPARQKLSGSKEAGPAVGGRSQRGRIELQIAGRLGDNGMDRLSACDEATVERLCQLQARGRLLDKALFELCPPLQKQTQLLCQTMQGPGLPSPHQDSEHTASAAKLREAPASPPPEPFKAKSDDEAAEGDAL